MLEVIEHGAGPEVVMVHGDVMGAEMTFAAQLPLADRYRLRLVNRRGFGKSPDVEGEDFEVDAADVADLLAPGTHLVGHSYGGVVALLAAARNPGAVRSLTVLEPPAFGLTATSGEAKQFRAGVEELLAQEPAPAEFLPAFLALVGGDPRRLPSPLPPPLERAAAVQMRGRWPWEAEIPLDRLRAAAIPTMVVSGEHSRLFDGVCDVLEAKLGARRVVLQGAGHSIPSLGEPLNGALEQFWTSIPGAA